jgi:hypothetical protein
MTLLTPAGAGQDRAMFDPARTLRAARGAVDRATAAPARWLVAVMDDHDALWDFDVLVDDDLDAAACA